MDSAASGISHCWNICRSQYDAWFMGASILFLLYAFRWYYVGAVSSYGILSDSYIAFSVWRREARQKTLIFRHFCAILEAKVKKEAGEIPAFCFKCNIYENKRQTTKQRRTTH